MSEQEYHPSAQFNPAHPDNAAWANGPKPPDMPAEAGIVEQFKGDEVALANAPAEAEIVASYSEPEGSEKPKTSRKR